MNQLLPVSKTIILQPNDVRCSVDAFLGGGGQGEVYRVLVQGQPKALKWYYAHSATPKQAQILQRLVEMGPPTSSGEFLWPEMFATCKTIAGFGYVMPLRESRFKGIVDMMRGDVNPSFQTLCVVGRRLAQCYWSLHNRGLCYRDINFNNVFFDPNTGEILICDNDNVSVSGEASDGVIGTPRFMAPEIVRGEAQPSADTDKYSLAVLLFYLFFVHHPLEGKRELNIHCFDIHAMNALYGKHPVFIFDPDDHSNRPVPGYHDNAIEFWKVYPTFLKRLFIRAFTEGLKPGRRVGETEWRRAFVQLADSIVYCQHCGRENFHDNEVHCHEGASLICWKCQQRVQIPFLLSIGKNIVVLRHDTKLYAYHISLFPIYDFAQPVAEVSLHPQNPSRWGLTNRSSHDWVATTANGDTMVVPPGKTVGLQRGLQIDFGEVSGVVE